MRNHNGAATPTTIAPSVGSSRKTSSRSGRRGMYSPIVNENTTYAQQPRTIRLQRGEYMNGVGGGRHRSRSMRSEIHNPRMAKAVSICRGAAYYSVAPDCHQGWRAGRTRLHGPTTPIAVPYRGTPTASLRRTVRRSPRSVGAEEFRAAAVDGTRRGARPRARTRFVSTRTYVAILSQPSRANYRVDCPDFPRPR